MYELVIIGAGPSGLSAGIYAKRAMLDSVILEKEAMMGGQILYTYEVENYPGCSMLGGFDLADKFREHAESLGVEFMPGEVEKIEKPQKNFLIHLADGKVIESKTIILATGAVRTKLGVTGEDEFAGRGVSYCATCDGAFFKDKITAVVGGGDAALEDAVYLARVCKKVYLIHRRDELRGSKKLQDAIIEAPNIEILWNSVIESINGDSKVTSANVKNILTNQDAQITLDGVFIAVGSTPITNLVKGMVDMDSHDYIIADETGVTSLKGMFAAGDIRTKQLRQIITAAADGANCVNSVEMYLGSEY